MKIDLSGLVRPHVVEMKKREDTPFSAEFRIQPLERGYGYTLGNALRRMLLSSLRGASVWAFRLEGVVHEHQTIAGVAEDIHQIIQRLKSLTLVLDEDVEEAVVRLKVEKAGPVYAKDLDENPSVKVVDPDHLLFTLEEDREVTGELYVNRGRGYVESSQHPNDRSMPVDVVRIDSIYNPVRRANFTVAETRVGQRTDFDSLSIQIETNGTISPEDAVAYAAGLIKDHLQYFMDFGNVQLMLPSAERDAIGGRDPERLRALLERPIEDCGLSVRSVNSLKNSDISTLRDLVAHSEDQMLKVKNVGEKALAEIAELLRQEGLEFGMRFKEIDGQLVLVPQPEATAKKGEEGTDAGTPETDDES